MRAASARPTENDRPWPSAPAAFSTPGVVPSSGWPWRRLFSLRNVRSSSTGKNPRSARAAYQTGQAWPLLRTNRSRSGHVGFFGSTRRMWKYSAVTMSAADIEPPGWPLCTLCVIRMMCFRRVTAFFLRLAMSSSETSTTACPAPLPARRRPGHDGGLLRALSRGQGGFFTLCTRDQTTAAATQRERITTTASAAPNPAIASTITRKVEASAKIQGSTMSRGSRVHRFTPPARRISGGVAEAIKRRSALVRMKYCCRDFALTGGQCRNGCDYNMATRRNYASGSRGRRFSLSRAVSLSVLNMFDHARSVLRPSNNSQILQMWFAGFETEERRCASDLLAWLR